MYVHAIEDLLGECVRLTLTIVGVSTAVEMAGALMDRATFSVSAIPATPVRCVRLLIQKLMLKLKAMPF
jgi:hypothetical protein